MKIHDWFGAAWKNLWRYRLRSLMTASGMMVGNALLILLLATGTGTRLAVLNNLSALGSNLVVLSPKGPTRLTSQTVTQLRTLLPNASHIVPILSKSGVNVASSSVKTTATVQGTTASFSPLRHWSVEAGQFISNIANSHALPVADIGYQMAEKLFPSGNPIGKTISVNGTNLTVIGIMKPKGTSFHLNNDKLILTPYSVLSSIYATHSASLIYVEAPSAAWAPMFTAEIAQLYSNRTPKQPVSVWSQDQILQTQQSANQSLSMLLAIEAGAAMVAGGLGIMNVMLVSLSERTREIGLRKAIGAKPADIFAQMIIESMSIGALGALIGLTVGHLAAQLLARMHIAKIGFLLSWDYWGFGLSIGLGILFGLMPALKAANLSPMEALRND